MRIRRTPVGSRAFAECEALEARSLLSAPPSLLGISIADEMTLSAGRPAVITLTATDDVGIAAATFFLDINKDNEWTEGVDRHLGEVFGPDAGSSDRFTFTYVLDQDAVGAQEGGGVTALRFAASARDGEGLWPVSAFTRDVRVYERPLLSFLMAEPVSSTQVRLTARVASPQGIPLTGVQGVTFWYDANGNAGWDPGIDTDLGYWDRAEGEFGLEYVLVATIDAQWPLPRQFAAAARDVRPVADRFGAPRATIARSTTATPPQIAFGSVTPWEIPRNVRIVSGRDIAVTLRSIDAGVQIGTFFHDANNNGLWDFAVDTDINVWGTGGQFNFSKLFFQNVSKSWGGGIISLAFAIRSAAGAGDDAWTPAYSVYFAPIFEAWVEPTTQNAYTIPFGTPLVMNITARDENAVRLVHGFLDLNSDNQEGPGDIAIAGASFTPLTTRARAGMLYSVRFGDDLPRGQYRVGLFAADFVRSSGPVTYFWLNVV